MKMALERLNQIANRFVRRVSCGLLGLLPFTTRAHVIEHLSEQMISVTETNSGPLRFYCPSPQLTMRAQTLLTKEPDMIQWLDSFALDSVFWDIGANVGVFSLYAASRRHASVVAFEPSAANFHVLSRNIQLNGLSDRLTAYCVALSRTTEMGVLNMTTPAMGSSMSQFGRPGEMSRYADKRVAGLAQGMIGFKVDDFVKQFRPPFPTYLKMDVDGLELPILQGASQTLSDSRLLAAMIELSLTNQMEHDQAVELLKGCGLHLNSKGEVQGTESEKAANHLFVRRP